MSKRQGPSPDEITDRLAARMRTMRDERADAPESERREALRRALDEELSPLPDERASAVLDGLRQRLIDDARQRQGRVTELESRVAELEGQLAAAQATNERLKTEGGTAQAAAVAAGSGEGFARIREGLKKIAAGKKNITAESVGLPESEAGLFRVIQEMLRFAQDYEMGLNFLLSEFKVGPQADMDTKMIRGMTQQVRKRFKDCCDDKPGAVDELKQVLQRNSRFLIDLNKAYNDSFHQGMQAVLKELDPQPILEKHKRMLGHNFEEAWQDYVRVQGDLATLPRSELWERFFFQAFREKLGDYLGG